MSEEYKEKPLSEEPKGTETDESDPYTAAINKKNELIDSQIKAVQDYEKAQIENQNAATDFTIKQINQQKKAAKEAYQKELSDAYVAYKKQSDPRSAEAEQLASGGLSNSGYSESLRIAQYNQYQNRVAAAKEIYNYATVSYDNAMNEARTKNSSVLAEIAYDSLMKQLSIGINGVNSELSILESMLNSSENDDTDDNLTINNDKTDAGEAARVEGYGDFQFSRDDLDALVEEGFLVIASDGTYKITNVSSKRSAAEKRLEALKNDMNSGAAPDGALYGISPGIFDAVTSFDSTWSDVLE